MADEKKETEDEGFVNRSMVWNVAEFGLGFSPFTDYQQTSILEFVMAGCTVLDAFADASIDMDD